MSAQVAQRNEALRKTFVAAAREILATEGYGALKQRPLCKKLGVTTGAFYHSFDDWNDFATALLESWLSERSACAHATTSDADDPVERLRNLARATSNVEHRVDAAIRVWAGVDKRVADVQRRLDEYRYRVVRDAMEVAAGPARADAFTAWTLSTLIGYEALPSHDLRDQPLWSVERILYAASATASDSASFRRRSTSASTGPAEPAVEGARGSARASTIV